MRAASCSVKPEHGELIGYAVQKTISEAVIVKKQYVRRHVNDIRAANLQIVGSCEIRSRTPECMGRTPGSRPIVSACDAAESYRRTVNQSRQDSALLLHADQRVIIVRTVMATIEDARPQPIAGLEQKAARQLRRPTDLAT